MSDQNQTPPTSGNSPEGDEYRRRMRFQREDLIEELIEDGQRRGLFEGLPGTGRPLDLEQNIYEGSATLANRLMKNNDIRPAWLSYRIDVTEKIEAFRAEVRVTWERYRLAFEQAAGDSHRPALSIGWDDACRRWQTTIEQLNKAIDSYNLKRPPGQLELLKLRLTDELNRVDAPRYLL